MNNKILVILFVIGLFYGIWDMFFRACPKCNGRLKMDEMKDSMGKNISKLVTVSSYKGPRKMTYIYRCKQCPYEIVKKSWEWN